MNSGHSYGQDRRSRARRAGDRPAGVRPDAAEHWVRVTCPACGVVRVPIDAVALRNCVDDRSWSYRARCSSCDTLFVAATPATLALPAVAAGVPVEQWSLPKPSRRRARGPLRDSDARELHIALERPDWIDVLARDLPPEVS